MSTRVLDRVDDWDQVAFEGGYAGLQALAENDFSGVARAGAVEVFMANGAVIGVEHGTIEDVEGSDGTAYRAPHEGLPLLGVMQARSDEVKAKYYSEDTPISEVDRTLSGGGFSGYIELAENVLSGDYYIVYHGGESLSAGFVGASSQLITGDEAFETADDEVGIFEVRPVDIEPVAIPEPSGAAAAAGTAAAADDAAEPETATDDPQGERSESSSEATDAGPERNEPTDDGAAASGASADADAGDSSASDRAQPSTTADAAGASTSSEPSERGRTDDPDAETEAAGTATSAGADDRTAERSAETGPATTTSSEATPERGRGGAGAEPDGPPTPEPAPEAETSTYTAGDAVSADTSAGASSDPADLETRAIPSLDPGRTVTPDPVEPDTAGSKVSRAGSGATQGQAGAQPQAEGQAQEAAQPQAGGQAQAEGQTEGQTEAREAGSQAAQAEAGGSAAGGQQAGETGAEAAGGRVADLEAELDEREADIDRLETEVADAEAEAQELASELEQVREERDELREERDRLAAELDRLEEEYGEAVHAETRLTASEALDQTNLFVRYDSKGKATLEGAADGEFSREQVANNVRLEYHTQFDQSAVAVGGESYDVFLEKTLEFRFVDWVIHELLFEIRDTGTADALAELYEALPKIDRAELHGSVSVTFTSDGQEKTAEEGYDVILRDRMGNPLVVANLNDSREAATETMMTGLLQSAEHVGLSEETFVSAFIVTESFFEPAALEVAADATRSGILSRDKRQSYVNLSRKNGYHLCLVEARDRNFHLAVPEL